MTFICFSPVGPGFKSRQGIIFQNNSPQLNNNNYQTSTQLRYHHFDNHLKNQPQVGTLICRSLLYLQKKIIKPTDRASWTIFMKDFLTRIWRNKFCACVVKILCLARHNKRSSLQLLFLLLKSFLPHWSMFRLYLLFPSTSSIFTKKTPRFWFLIYRKCVQYGLLYIYIYWKYWDFKSKKSTNGDY